MAYKDWATKQFARGGRGRRQDHGDRESRWRKVYRLCRMWFSDDTEVRILCKDLRRGGAPETE